MRDISFTVGPPPAKLKFPELIEDFLDPSFAIEKEIVEIS